MGNMIIVGPNGKRFKVNAPAGTSVQEIEETFARENGGARGRVVSDQEVEQENARLADLKKQYDAYTSTPEYRSQQMGLSGNSILDYDFSSGQNIPTSIDTRVKRVVPENPDEIGYLRRLINRRF